MSTCLHCHTVTEQEWRQVSQELSNLCKWKCGCNEWYMGGGGGGGGGGG